MGNRRHIGRSGSLCRALPAVCHEQCSPDARRGTCNHERADEDHEPGAMAGRGLDGSRLLRTVRVLNHGPGASRR